jgi:hypothetical protein
MFRFCRNKAPIGVNNDGMVILADGSEVKPVPCTSLPKKDVVYDKPMYKMTKSEHMSWLQKHKYR